MIFGHYPIEIEFRWLKGKKYFVFVKMERTRVRKKVKRTSKGGTRAGALDEDLCH